jgi:polar amino acid transport system substrate-binding protein
VNPRIALPSFCVAFALIAAACSGQSSDVSDTAHNALAPVTTSTTIPSATTTTVPPECADVLKSLPATTPLPAPGNFPANGALRKIYERGYLLAGIDENTPHLGERDPGTAEFDGLEVELTASADSITCERKQDVAFSSEYLRTGHVLLVRKGGITTKEQLAGRPVCVTAGSSSVKLLAEQMPDARPVEVDARNDCLVALQQGDADAYLGHTTFVRGMQEQDDQNLVMIPDSLRTQNYGIAIAKDHPELVGFVNGVLQQMRDDGRLADLFARYGLPACENPANNIECAG